MNVGSFSSQKKFFLAKKSFSSQKKFFLTNVEIGQKTRVSRDPCLASEPLFYHLRRTLSLIVLADFIYGRIFLGDFGNGCCPFLQFHSYKIFRHFLESFGEVFGRQNDQESFWSGESCDNRVSGRNPKWPRKTISRRKNTAQLQKHFVPREIYFWTRSVQTLNIWKSAISEIFQSKERQKEHKCTLFGKQMGSHKRTSRP